MLIEQAIYTSADTDRAQGYQLIAHSPGLSETDCAELTRWGPAHDALSDGQPEKTSTNFHRMASGAYAVSRTSMAGAEYSGRGAARVYTQFLVLPTEVLLRFGNNPFAVIRAATASGVLRTYDEVPESLDPVRLSGRAPAVYPSLLAQLACRPGPEAMATLIQAALSSDQLAVAAPIPADTLLAGLLNLLPVECRTEFSFSTGLKYSPSRPYRVSHLPDDRAAWRAIGRYGVTLLSLDTVDTGEEPNWEGWAGCVADVLKSGRISLLATQLERRRPTLTCAGLADFAEVIRALAQPRTMQVASVVGQDQPSVGQDSEAEVVAPPAVSGADQEYQQRADAAYAQLPDDSSPEPAPADSQAVDHLIETLAHQPAEALDLLEEVDDLVFTAISGDRHALEELQSLWPAAVADLDSDVIDQSREQYLRCALSIWEECADDEMRSPQRAMSAIDVLCVLFDQ